MSGVSVFFHTRAGAGRAAPCLHLVFIMLKVLRCPRDSPLLWCVHVLSATPRLVVPSWQRCALSLHPTLSTRRPSLPQRRAGKGPSSTGSWTGSWSAGQTRGCAHPRASPHESAGPRSRRLSPLSADPAFPPIARNSSAAAASPPPLAPPLGRRVTAAPPGRRESGSGSSSRATCARSASRCEPRAAHAAPSSPALPRTADVCFSTPPGDGFGEGGLRLLQARARARCRTLPFS